MSILDIFKDDAFSVTSLTGAMREIKHVPGYISRKRLFQVSSIDTLSVAIEKDKQQNLRIVPSSPRGGPGSTFGKNKRSMLSMTVPHFQVDDAIYADEVQSVRGFGQEQQRETFMSKIANRAAEASQFFALTEEFHRLKVLTTGKLFDSDGTTVLADFLTLFGESLPAELDFSFDTNVGGKLRKFCAGVHRQMAQILDGLPFSGIEAICGDDFFDDLVGNEEVRAAYEGHAGALQLLDAYVSGSGQNDTFGEVSFGGIRFVNYRGYFNGQVAVHKDKAHLYPLGVPGLFQTVYAPADYIETVNTMGQRLYAKQWRMDNDKGINLEYQTNALHYCTRPRVLLRAKRT
ncbi:major capsid protein [Hoeflea sp.]|uniref:major capsid protein n=1 Tax=Hoeflea sp. TaxID=1940281 RepID=UPI003B522667